MPEWTRPRRSQPAIITWYETAKHAFERGADWQNMGGIENDLKGGLYSFKSSSIKPLKNSLVNLTCQLIPSATSSAYYQKDAL